MNEQDTLTLPNQPDAALENGSLPQGRTLNGESSQNEDAPSLQFSQNPFHLLNGAVYFNGHCDTCRPFCAAVCCRGYSFVSLTEEEANSGLYTYKKESTDCDCAICQKMRGAGVKYALYKRHDGNCIYLDGTGQCSIYNHRPKTCRQYSCVNVPFTLNPA